MVTGESAILVIGPPYSGLFTVFPFKEAYFSAYWLPTTISLRNSWVSQLLTGPYATLNIALVTLISPFWIAVSLVIFWRRSDDWMALFIALFLVMLVTGGSPALSVLSSVVGFT